MTTNETVEPVMPAVVAVSKSNTPTEPIREEARLEERGLHLISDRIGLISPILEATGVPTTINNSNNQNNTPKLDQHREQEDTTFILSGSHDTMLAVVNNESGKETISLAGHINNSVDVQTNCQTTNTAVSNNLQITNEGDGRINNNRRDELTVPHSHSTTSISTKSDTSYSSSSSSSSTSSTASFSSSSSSSSSQPSSAKSSPPRVMIPQPSRSSVTLLESNRVVCEAVAEDEAVLNMAAALVSISTVCPAGAPCAPSHPSTTAILAQEHLEAEPCEPGKIKAYAKLHGPEWSFFLKKPSLTMGRAPSQTRQFTAGDSCPVDFYLSSADSLSRTHLRIDYNPDRQRWEMSCLGKSGVKVDKRRFEAFCPPIPLFNESVITVANATFSFSLPVDPNEPASSREASPFERLARKRKSVDEGATGGTENRENQPNTSPGNTQNKDNTNQDDDDDLYDNDGDYEDTASLVGVGEYSKPPQSYANLIAEAINSTPNKRMTLSCIYQYLADKYPYFRHTKNGWQNSVRHNLSLNKAFKKVPRGLDEPGKGMLWIIDPEFKHLVDGSIGRRASVRSRTPDMSGPQQRPLTFIHHHQSMFQQQQQQQHHQQHHSHPGYPHHQHAQYQQQQQQQHQHYMLYQQQHMRSHAPILPAPDTTHLRPIATIAAAISASTTVSAVVAAASAATTSAPSVSTASVTTAAPTGEN